MSRWRVCSTTICHLRLPRTSKIVLWLLFAKSCGVLECVSGRGGFLFPHSPLPISPCLFFQANSEVLSVAPLKPRCAAGPGPGTPGGRGSLFPDGQVPGTRGDRASILPDRKFKEFVLE